MQNEQYLTDDELDRNYDAFKEALSAPLSENEGRFAVIRNGKIIDVFDTSHGALKFGWDKYEDDLFSIQKITDEPVYLGIYSHAVDIRAP